MKSPYTFAGFALALFLPVTLQAQEAPAAAVEYISQESLDQRLGKDWRGILYACDPYCRFVSIRENEKWNPDIAQVRVPFSTLQTVAQTDPIYPLLVARSPVKPYVEPPPPGMTKQEREKRKRELERPSFAKTSYGLGWSVKLGESYRMMTLESNTEIQSDLAPKSSYLGLEGQGSVMLAPGSLYKMWVQHGLDLDYTSGTYQTKDATSVNTGAMGVTYKLWRLKKSHKMGPRVSWRTEDVKAGSDSLTHFSYSWTGYLLGWELVWRRWTLVADWAVMSTLKEEQGFRASPLKQDIYRVKAGYCSRDFSLFDLDFGICGNFGYGVDKQQAPLASNLVSDSDSQLNATRMELGLLLRIGEDFFK